MSKKAVKVNKELVRALLSNYTPNQQIRALQVSGDYAVKMTAVRYTFILGLLYLAGKVTVTRPIPVPSKGNSTTYQDD